MGFDAIEINLVTHAVILVDKILAKNKLPKGCKKLVIAKRVYYLPSLTEGYDSNSVLSYWDNLFVMGNHWNLWEWGSLHML